jgi:hypothetical protein
MMTAIEERAQALRQLLEEVARTPGFVQYKPGGWAGDRLRELLTDLERQQATANVWDRAFSGSLSRLERK